MRCLEVSATATGIHPPGAAGGQHWPRAVRRTRRLCAPARPPTRFPPTSRRLLEAGLRPDWSHDGRHLLFLDDLVGNVFELDLESRSVRPLTSHFEHAGFTRARYLASGDILLCGPQPSDASRTEQRSLAHGAVVPRRGSLAPRRGRWARPASRARPSRAAASASRGRNRTIRMPSCSAARRSGPERSPSKTASRRS